MSDKKCYELPLTPQDLVAIYKDKEDNKNFVLWVDYAKSRQKLSAQHLLIYLANTNFKSTFSAIDEDLLVEYIKSDFMVDSPLLARMIAIIIKFKYQHPLTEPETQLLAYMSADQIEEFLKVHGNLVEELCVATVAAVPFILYKIWEGMSDETRELEVNLKETVEKIVITDTPTNCGPNAARLMINAFDAFSLILSQLGYIQTFNKALYNDRPKYFGKDLFYLLNETGIVNNVISWLPPKFLISIDVSKA
jgi:hypothetical protein